ncbi:MAG: hypothetical protein ACHQNT_10995 [Bacteroidia bacterium]
MFERLYISEIQVRLQYKRRRSVIRWCNKNGVRIFTDTGCKKPYVLKEEFEAAVNKEPKKYIKEKYGTDKVSDVFHAYSNVFSEYNTALNEKHKIQLKSYKSKGKIEKEFLAHLTVKLAEL